MAVAELLPEYPGHLDLIPKAVKLLAEKQKDYQLYRKYFNGDHDLAFATERFRTAFGTVFKAYASNLCPDVVQASTDRLQVIGFDDEAADDTGLGAAAWEIWQKNRMDQASDEVHTEALRCGDSYVIVWPYEENEPTIYPQDAADVRVYYDREKPGTILWACKVWPTDDGKRWRLNLYLPESIEKYVTLSENVGQLPDSSSGWVKHEDLEDGGWPVDNRWGVVPVFHFAPGVGRGKMGYSELRGVIPPQNALNKTVMDMLIGAEYVGLKHRYVIGIEVEIDPATGLPKQPLPSGCEHLAIFSGSKQDIEVGQFEESDLGPLIDLKESFQEDIARISRTPGHYLMVGKGPTREWPSGEALKTAEAPFTAKVEKFQTAFGNVWEDVMALALRMAGSIPEGQAVRLETLWASPAPKSDLTLAQVVLLDVQSGIPLRISLKRRYGWTDEQLDEVEQAGAGMGSAMLTTFEKGQGQ